MKAYFEENVLPVIKIQRQELDQKISPADKTRLAEIRTEMKSMRTMMMEKRDEMRAEDKKPSLEMRKEMREHRNKMHDLMDEVAVMSEKYDRDITAALENIRENADTWKEKREEMRENCPYRDNDQRSGRPQGDRPGRGFHRGPGGDVPMHRILSPEGFLLFDPEEPMPFFGDAEMAGDQLEVNLFPNPASESVQVSVSVPEDSNITIEIMDKDGNVVVKGKEVKAGEGIYTENINIGKLDTGVYFVKIKSGTNTTVERLIVQ